MSDENYYELSSILKAIEDMPLFSEAKRKLMLVDALENKRICINENFYPLMSDEIVSVALAITKK